MKAYIDTEAKEIRVIGSVTFSELDSWIRLLGEGWTLVGNETDDTVIINGGTLWGGDMTVPCAPYPNDVICATEAKYFHIGPKGIYKVPNN